MQVDRNKLWRIVENNYRALREVSPAGYAPVVEVFVVGRPEPVRLGEVHTSRDPHFPWALLVAETEGDGKTPTPDENLVFATEQYVERIEIRYVP